MIITSIHRTADTVIGRLEDETEFVVSKIHEAAVYVAFEARSHFDPASLTDASGEGDAPDVAKSVAPATDFGTGAASEPEATSVPEWPTGSAAAEIITTSGTGTGDNKPASKAKK